MTAAPMATTTIRQVALEAHDAGLSVVPPAEDGTKRTDCEWLGYQVNRPAREQVEAWYSGNRTGLGIVQGAVSGGLETLEFDDYDTYLAFKTLADASVLGDLVKRIEEGYLEQTPGAGVHWPYYCTKIAGNTKLARRPKAPDEMNGPKDTVKVLIETRGEGGYLVIAPSHGRVHPSGKPYVLLSGGVTTISTITPDERRDLWTLARTFDLIPAGADEEAVRPPVNTPSGRPGDDYNSQENWTNILRPHGWTHVFGRNGVDYWRRPEKQLGVSATTNHQGSGLLYVFSTSTEFEAERGYSKFGAYGLLNHNSDYKVAAKALADLGYGSREYQPETPGTNGHQPDTVTF